VEFSYHSVIQLTRENKVLGNSLSHWRCVQHEIHMDSSGIEACLSWWENGT